MGPPGDKQLTQQGPTELSREGIHTSPDLCRSGVTGNEQVETTPASPASLPRLRLRGRAPLSGHPVMGGGAQGGCVQRPYPGPQVPGRGQGLVTSLADSTPGSWAAWTPSSRLPPGPYLLSIPGLLSHSLICCQPPFLGGQFHRWQQRYCSWNTMNDGGSASGKTEDHQPLSRWSQTFWTCLLEKDGFLPDHLKFTTANPGSRCNLRHRLCNQKRLFVN